MIDYHPPMFPGEHFHVYNRGNNRENIFIKPDNARYFLNKYLKYLHPVLETYAYCLLPNHFHLLVRVKTLDEILAAGENEVLPDFKTLTELTKLRAESLTSRYISDKVSEQFRLLFMSYAKAINKQENRVGSLFQKPFKRLSVASQPHLLKLILYIHANPQLHNLHGDFRDWADSSYSSLLSDSPTSLQRTKVLNCFGGKEQFILQHNRYIDWKMAGKLLIED